MDIILDTDTSDCPGCVCKILNGENESENVLVQTDWDAPSVASTFGWNIREVKTPGRDCDHRGTDGTVDCRECGVKASTFIAEAMEWINNNDGATAEDPGYFGGDE